MFKNKPDKLASPNLNKRILVAAGIMVAIVFLAVWILSLLEPIKQPGDQSQNNPIILPDDGLASSQIQAQLYFRYLDDSMLAPDTRRIQLSADEPLEKAVLTELIKGPNSSKPELERTINAQTEIVAIKENGSILVVTLSAEYLSLPSSLPTDWAWDLALREETFLQRRLAAQSIVNTITGLGTYSEVQILVDKKGDKTGTNVSWAELGFEKKHDYAMWATPIAYDASVVLNAANTTRILIMSAVENSYSRLYRYISSKDQSGIPKPGYEAFVQLIKDIPRIEKFEILDCIITSDGKGALVHVNVQYRLSDGSVIQRENLPVVLNQVNEVWYAPVDVVYSLLRAE